MIKRFCIVFAFIYLLMSPMTVHADVIHSNDFFNQNQEKTKLVGDAFYGKRFVINSPSGYVIPNDEPGSGKGIPSDSGYSSYQGNEGKDYQKYNVFLFENGEICYIEATYFYNGAFWGIMSPNHMYQPSGWVRMDELLVIYDPQDFEIENKDDFYTYTGSYDAVLSAQKLVEWQWPGSDQEKRIIEDKDTIQKCANIIYAYRDNEGREWGKTDYSEGWICLSDPENSKISAFNPAPNPTKWSPDGHHDWSADVVVYPSHSPALHLQLSGFSLPLLIAILVVVLVAGTVILVRIFRKPNRDKS